MKAGKRSRCIKYRTMRSGRIRISISEHTLRYRMHVGGVIGCIFEKCRSDAKFILPMPEPDDGFCGTYCTHHADMMVNSETEA